MKRFALVLIALFVLGVAIWLLDRPGDAPLLSDGPAEPYSHDAFDTWVAGDPARQREFADLVHYLTAEGVGDVVPVWQLTRSDSNRAKTCKRPEFLIPPREDWENIVPVLALVRDHIVPEVGTVEVVSSYRTTAFNHCVGGADKSRHLSFSALDLMAQENIENTELFARLCALQAQLGPQSRFGLGAYFDPKEPGKASGRFHVDVSGFRSWGASKRSDSSGCKT